MQRIRHSWTAGLLIGALFLSLSARGQEVLPSDSNRKKEESVWEGVKKAGNRLFDSGKEAAGEVQARLAETRDLRAESRWSLLLNYSPVDTWIPSKYGITLAYIPEAEGGWELEYLRGALSFEFFIKDLGKMTDERLSLIRRFYSDRNSLSFLAGLAYHSFSIHLGDRLTSLVTGNVIPSIDLVKVRTLGIEAGLGNRWQFEGGWTLGVDWFSFYLPLKTLEADAPFITSSASESGKSDVRDVMDVIKHIPTFAVLKFQLGITF